MFAGDCKQWTKAWLNISMSGKWESGKRKNNKFKVERLNETMLFGLNRTQAVKSMVIVTATSRRAHSKQMGGVAYFAAAPDTVWTQPCKNSLVWKSKLLGSDSDRAILRALVVDATLQLCIIKSSVHRSSSFFEMERFHILWSYFIHKNKKKRTIRSGKK